MKPKQKNILCSAAIAATAFVGLASGDVLAQSANDTLAAEVAVSPPSFLNLEFKSACTENGALFKVTNHGKKWPRNGHLRLYHADNKSLISERRLRLAPGQSVSFVVKQEIMKYRPVAVWIDPEWYDREMEYDATITCE